MSGLGALHRRRLGIPFISVLDWDIAFVLDGMAYSA